MEFINMADRKSSLIIILFIVNIYAAFGQIKDEIICQVIDDISAQPVTFATIRVKNKNIGTIANEDGYFRIPEQFRLTKDTLVISSIGFETKEIALVQLNPLIRNTIVLKEKLVKTSNNFRFTISNN